MKCHKIKGTSPASFPSGQFWHHHCHAPSGTTTHENGTYKVTGSQYLPVDIHFAVRCHPEIWYHLSSPAHVGAVQPRL